MQRVVLFCVLALVVVACGGGGVSTTSGTPETSTAAPIITTTTPQTTIAPPTSDGFPNEWNRVAVGASWTERIIDAAALPDGGFVVANSAPDSPTVVWSPDGVDWLDGDPQRRLPEQLGPVGRPDPAPPGSMAVIGDRVAILDWRMSVWVGDPSIGDWQEIPLEVKSEEEGDFAWGRWGNVGLALASNGSQVLVLGAHQIDSGDELVMWLVDPLELTSVRVSTLTTLPLNEWPMIQVAWFAGQWVIGANVMVDEPSVNYAGEETDVHGMLWFSTDAVAWTEIDYGADWMGMLEPRGSQLILLVGSLGGDRLWSTYDLVDWEVKWSVDDETDFVVPYYSEALGYFGFVDMDPSGPGETWLMVSDDGTNWTPLGPSRYGDVVAVSGDRVLLSTFDQLWLLTSEKVSPAPDTASTSIPTTTSPDIGYDPNPATAHEVYSDVGRAWVDAFVARDPAALAELYRSDAVHVDGFSDDEARGRDQIEAVFARHFEQTHYTALEPSGYSIGWEPGADGNILLNVGLFWDWGAAPGDTSLYGMPAASRLLIDIDSRLIAWSTHPDPMAH